MAFKMICPKCTTTDYSITRDRRISYQDDEISGLVYSCRCGKMMFGAQIQEEYERQHKEWKADAGSRGEQAEPAQAEPARAEEQAVERAMQERSERKQQEEAQAAARKKEEQQRSWSAKAAVDDDDDELDDDTGESDDEDTCAWHPCSKPRRPRSKYCSRACSNKNARYRHKQRKRKGGRGKDREAA